MRSHWGAVRNRTMKIALVIHEVGEQGGQERSAYEWCRYLCRRGHEVHLFARAIGDEMLSWPGFHLHRVPCIDRPYLLRCLTFFVMATIMMRRERFDAIHTNGAVAWPYDVTTCQFCHTSWSRWERDIPRLVSFGRYCYHRVFTRANSWLERRYYLKRGRVVAVLSPQEKEGLERLGVPAGRIEVIPHGISAEAWEMAGRRQECRRKLEEEFPVCRSEAGRQKALFLFAGDLGTSRKGAGVLLEAWAKAIPLAATKEHNRAGGWTARGECAERTSSPGVTMDGEARRNPVAQLWPWKAKARAVAKRTPPSRTKADGGKRKFCRENKICGDDNILPDHPLLLLAGRLEHSPFPAMAERLGIVRTTIFLGSRREIFSIMSGADCLVFPSCYEPFGLVVAEALAAGLPVAMPLTVGVAGWLKPSEDFIPLADPLDAEKIKEAILWVLGHLSEARETAERGREKLAGFTWEKAGARYEEWYRG